MKKKIVAKLHLSKETLLGMNHHDLEKVAGGITEVIPCGGTTLSFSQQQGSCPNTWRCCY